MRLTAFRDIRGAGGFTLIELLVTLSLVGLIALVAVPLAEVTSVRQKESEMRVGLRTIRSALDAYKAVADAGDIARETGASGYPPSLEILVDGVDAVARPALASASTPAPRKFMTWDGPSDSAGAAASASAAAVSAAPKRYYFLRKIPRDPFFEDPSVTASQTWALRSYASRPDDPQPGADVFDVASKSTRTAFNGTPDGSW